MVDLKDRGEMPADAPYDCLIEIDEEECEAIIRWTESLQFHAEYADNWMQYTNDDGWLRPTVESRLANRLNELIRDQAGVIVDVDLSENNQDEPNITFEVVTGYREGETYGAWLDRIGWPVVATLINVTDPGTFNSAYLFDMPEVVK